MKTFFCIADEDTVRGFRLAGVDGEVVESPARAADALTRAAARPDLGIIILTPAVAAAIRDEVDRLRGQPELPLVVEIPWPETPHVRRKSLREFMQEAVGIRIGTEDLV
jgi:V/A-type H+/Na+-transporting ATPase subunit F